MSGFEGDDGHKNSLRTGQEGQVLVPGVPGGAETRPESGLIRAALGESWPAAFRLGAVASALGRPQPGWGPRPQSPRVQATHQLAWGPPEYFRVESPFASASPPLPSIMGT